ncbi:Protein of unknown function DUF541 [Penicillium italicum]|uniref:Uncharacterized protein n=1 Tax=Penicillium italicum TaxID=40296 RepID=A0A0A2LDQ2_PENIT|nr:Protein of unknown function DUF541 [Penicillium italicum]
MAPLSIFVDGKSSVTRQAERGNLNFIIKAIGTDREGLSKKVTETSNDINRLFKELSPKADTGEIIPGSPVTSFSSTSLETRFHFPRDEEGERLPTVYHANLSLHAVFQDFAKLNEVVGKLIFYPNIEIASLGWCLTEATQMALSSESREEAMRDAVQKANDYARVVRREVDAVDIRETGGGLQYGMNSRMIPGQHNLHMQSQMATMQMQQQQVVQSNTGQPTVFDSPTIHLDSYLSGSPALDLNPQLIRYLTS